MTTNPAPGRNVLRKVLLILILAGVFSFGIVAHLLAAGAGPENNKLKVKVGPFFIQESEKKINLEGPGPHVMRSGKRINVVVTVENYGKEMSEPVRLKYVDSDRKSEPRFYRVQAIKPGEKWVQTFMTRYDKSGKKSVTATLTTLEDKPLTDAKGKPLPDTSNTGTVNLSVKKM
jgi:hypothetical protein